MNLLDSLLDAIDRLEGDALVMHVGEKPYVVTATSAMSEFRGPLLWGHVDLSSRVLTSEAVLGLLEQILPLDQRQALQELGAVEHQIDGQERNARFSVIAARAGDDVWVEVRRRPKEAAVAVQQPVVDHQAPAAEPVVERQEVTVVEGEIEPPVDVSVAERIEQPVHLAETVEAVQQPAFIDSPVAVSSEEFEQPAPARFDGAASAIDAKQDASEAAFEIVHEVNQDAPTDADVDALLAESAAALLRSAASAPPSEPFELDDPWQALGQPDALAFEPEPDLVVAIDSLIAASAPAVVPEPMALASQTDSIAIAPELKAVAVPREIERVPEIAGVETEPVVPESIVPELEAALVSADAEYDPVAFAEEFSGEDEYSPEAAATEFVPEPVAIVPQLELVAVGATAKFAPVALTEGFRLVAPTVDSFAQAPLAIELEPESGPLGAEAQPELFTFAEDVLSSEDFGLPAMPRGPALGSARILAETAPQPVYREPEPVGAALEYGNLHQVPQPAATVSVPDPRPVSVHREQPVMASVPIHEPDEQPKRAVIKPLARVPAAGAAGEIGGAKAGPVQRDSTSLPATDLAPEFSIDELLRSAAARGASTVYLVAQSRPMVRTDGDISVLEIGGGTPLHESDITRLMLGLAPEAARDAWQRGAAADWICDVAEVGRVRCMSFRDHRGPGLIFRMIPPQAIAADHLGLTPEVQALCAQSDGLVLVTGPRLSGKSTLMSAFVDLINRTRSDHVITIESQIEFVHESRRSFISQREVAADDHAIVSAVRSAMREDPDVLFIGDLSSADVATVALDAAEAGRLVFASLPAPSTIAAVDRLLELVPADRSHARASLAASLRGVVAEIFVGRMRGGRVAAHEVLLNTAAVADLIQEAKTDQLQLAMESGRRHGMMPLNDALTALVREGTVHVTEAYRKAFDKESLLAALRQEGVDTSFAEKIA